MFVNVAVASTGLPVMPIPLPAQVSLLVKGLICHFFRPSYLIVETVTKIQMIFHSISGTGWRLNYTSRAF